MAETAAFRSAFRNETNVFYGQHPAQILDIYYPTGVSGSAPVYIFLHGGAFREGHPAQYGFVGKPHVERGAIFVCAGYRLAPDCYYPDTIQDVAAMIGWLYHNIGSRGGDPNRLVLSGHSSGSTVSHWPACGQIGKRELTYPRTFCARWSFAERLMISERTSSET